MNEHRSKADRNYFAVFFAFLPFLLLLMTGSIMLFYHISQSKLWVLGLKGEEWLWWHKCMAVIAFPFVLWHLLLHKDWFVHLFRFKLKNKYKGINIALFIVFCLCVLTATFSWLVFQENIVGEALCGTHSKLGFALIMIFIFHVKNYFSWIVRMTKKNFMC